jgi:hypothetical protein
MTPKDEQLAAIKFCSKAGFSILITSDLIEKVYGKEALNRSNIVQWYAQFREEKRYFKNEDDFDYILELPFITNIDDIRTNINNISTNIDNIATKLKNNGERIIIPERSKLSEVVYHCRITKDVKQSEPNSVWSTMESVFTNKSILLHLLVSFYFTKFLSQNL